MNQDTLKATRNGYPVRRYHLEPEWMMMRLSTNKAPSFKMVSYKIFFRISSTLQAIWAGWPKSMLKGRRSKSMSQVDVDPAVGYRNEVCGRTKSWISVGWAKSDTSNQRSPGLPKSVQRTRKLVLLGSTQRQQGRQQECPRDDWPRRQKKCSSKEPSKSTVGEY